MKELGAFIVVMLFAYSCMSTKRCEPTETTKYFDGVHSRLSYKVGGCEE